MAGYSSANRAWHYFRSGFCLEAPRWRTFRVNFNSWFLLDPPNLTSIPPLPPSSSLDYITSRQMEESLLYDFPFHSEQVVRRTQLSSATRSRNDLNGRFAQLPIALSVFSLSFSLERGKEKERDRMIGWNDREELLNLTCLLESSEWN